jgi:LDH2 family malate/lactate/ureidoglycolate dehydrogenase
MRVPSFQIKRQLVSVFRAWGMSEAHAETTGEMMVETDLRGVDSHGVSMLPTYDQELCPRDRSVNVYSLIHQSHKFS